MGESGGGLAGLMGGWLARVRAAKRSAARRGPAGRSGRRREAGRPEKTVEGQSPLPAAKRRPMEDEASARVGVLMGLQVD